MPWIKASREISALRVLEQLFGSKQDIAPSFSLSSTVTLALDEKNDYFWPIMVLDG